ncbi:dynamin family protein [Bacteroides sp. ET336]|uniref:dynamin family protein n=1 Tax=Bacteroides sp. ET336 TaxID=2972459 RepID=UPI0021AC9F3C|nr:dynamin family protein [Bacteroides sp. ET336]MCR8894827.1 dynamin family protein [Bacteroides sp. ET336]MDN0059323.1 dynamin family protein [Bacteroides caecigallinarum]
MDENIKEQAMALKSKIIKLMGNMKSFTVKYPKAGLPKPSNDFILSEELLTKGDFNLAVCGKVKNGKSSLINALIGKNILPVCNDVATSRAFKISNANEDSFFVVYSNGDKKAITVEELAQYGSQAEIDNVGEIATNETIAYIQVNTKVDFLPEGVSLIDTPGIGSTYPQHTNITKQYLRNSDAALFVMNPSPLEDIEINFLKEVAEITPSIIFVTTKIDLCGNQVVNDTMERNKNLISKAIGEKLVLGLYMLKMSSSLLMDAAQSSDEVISNFNYEISGYADVKDAIQNICFLTLGYYRVGIAYNNAVEYYQIIQESLQNRKEASIEAATKYEQLISQYDKANKEFSEKMGDNKKKEVLMKIETILKTMEMDFNQIFTTKGEISEKYTQEIENLSSEEIALYGEDLGERIVNDVKKSWDGLTNLVCEKISSLLIQYNDECKLSITDSVKISVSGSGVGDPQIQNVDLRDRVGKMRTEMFMGTAVTGALGTLIGGAYYFLPTLVAPALPVLAPVMVVLGVGAVLWGAISGNNKAKRENLQKNKAQLLKYVQECLANCRKQLIETSLANNQYQSLYQGFLLAIRQQATTSISSTYEKYKSELDAMKTTIIQSKQNPEYIKAIEQLITQWTVNKNELNNIHTLIESIK